MQKKSHLFIYLFYFLLLIFYSQLMYTEVVLLFGFLTCQFIAMFLFLSVAVVLVH